MDPYHPENPLYKEFLSIEQLAGFFRRVNKKGKEMYGEKWIRGQMAEGNLPYHTYGRNGVLFYVPEVRQAILSGRLTPLIQKKAAQEKFEEFREPLRKNKRAGDYNSIQELREAKARGEIV